MNALRSSLLKPANLHRTLSAPTYLIPLKPPQIHVFHYPRRTFTMSRIFYTYWLPMYKKIRPPANKCTNYVGKNRAYIVERDGKYLRTLNSGIHLLNPFLDKIAYVHSLKEQTIKIPLDTVNTNKFDIVIDGLLFIKIVDPFLASYGNKEDDPVSAVVDLAKKTLPFRSMIEKVIFNEIFDIESDKYTDLDSLIFYNEQFVRILKFGEQDLMEMTDINKISTAWGVKCLQFVLRIHLPFKELLPWEMLKEVLIILLFEKRGSRIKRMEKQLIKHRCRMVEAVEKVRDYYTKKWMEGS